MNKHILPYFVSLYKDDIDNILTESTSITDIGGQMVDDGPTVFYDKLSQYKSKSQERIYLDGWQIIDYLMPDTELESHPKYPNASIGDSSTFPKGIDGDYTLQSNISNVSGYSQWKSQIDRIALKLGMFYADTLLEGTESDKIFETKKYFSNKIGMDSFYITYDNNKLKACRTLTELSSPFSVAHLLSESNLELNNFLLELNTKIKVLRTPSYYFNNGATYIKYKLNENNIYELVDVVSNDPLLSEGVVSDMQRTFQYTDPRYNDIDALDTANVSYTVEFQPWYDSEMELLFVNSFEHFYVHGFTKQATYPKFIVMNRRSVMAEVGIGKQKTTYISVPEWMANEILALPFQFRTLM